MNQLKALPREAVDRFCKKFEIAKIRELPASHVEKAKVFVAALVNDYVPQTQSAPATEVDPFG